MNQYSKEVFLLKIANENTFACSMFRKNLRAFIDNELPVNIKSVFLEHASKCSSCNLVLNEQQNLKKELAHLKRFSVSPEFDFRMRSSIRREHEKLRYPLYSFKIFVYKKFSKFIAVPACALLIIFGMVLYNNSNERQTVPVLTDVLRSHIDSQNGVELIPQNESSFVEEVHYVLETVKPSDVEKGIFLDEPEGTVHTSINPNDLTLVSF